MRCGEPRWWNVGRSESGMWGDWAVGVGRLGIRIRGESSLR